MPVADICTRMTMEKVVWKEGESDEVSTATILARVRCSRPLRRTEPAQGRWQCEAMVSG